MTVYAKNDIDVYVAFDSKETYERFVNLYAHGDLFEGETADVEAAFEYWKLLDAKVYNSGIITADELALYKADDYDIAQDLHDLVGTYGYSVEAHREGEDATFVSNWGNELEK